MGGLLLHYLYRLLYCTVVPCQSTYYTGWVSILYYWISISVQFANHVGTSHSGVAPNVHDLVRLTNVRE
jgi:hypothetical protein